MKKVCIYLFNGFSDWEIAYLTPELKKSELCELVYFSTDGKFVSSMGGMHIVPDKALSDIHPDEFDMLILPGGMMWDQSSDNETEALVKQMLAADKQVAAICGATGYLAKLGLLDDVKHTSNALVYLQWIAPQYKGASLYINESAMADKHIITAGGTNPIDFAHEILKALQLKSDEDIEKWYQLFKHGIWND